MRLALYTRDEAYTLQGGASGGPQSSKRRPPTTEVMGSNPVSNIWSHVGRVRQHSAEGRGFSPGSLVSSHREKLLEWVRINS